VNPPTTQALDDLARAAREARERAYAPYSGFLVGAAVLSDDGRLFAGVNVENASYGVAICAERTAVVKAVADGARRLTAVAVVASNDEPSWPCGACRQVLNEFGPDMVVVSEGLGGGREERNLRELLPHSFGPDDLR
jgi:cytidine deaminase